MNTNMLSTRKIRRNGLVFQIPTSIHSGFRYTVHPDGTGTSWDEDAPDVDQPHGLDYRSHQDIRKAVRIRLEKEHKTPASSSAGGEHLPGGCRVLGIVENTTDLSTGAGDKTGIDITDGLFKGRGIIYDQTNNALWCYTGDGTVSDDPYLLRFHPDRAWNSGDITWAGIHQFDSSVCFTDAEITGAWLFEGTVGFNDEVDFSAVNISGTLSIDGYVDAFGAWASLNTNTSYEAGSDGLVIVSYTHASTECAAVGYTDSNNPPTTARCRFSTNNLSNPKNVSFTMPVKKGDWFKIVSTGGTPTIYWLSIGA